MIKPSPIKDYMPKRIFTALDLELNQPSNKIIQIGAVVGDIYTGEILEKFCTEIKIDEILDPAIIKLTGITQEQMEKGGVSLLKAYMALVQVHKAHNSFMNPILWGGGDSQLLQQQISTYDIKPEWIFGRRWIDAKTLFIVKRIQDSMPLQSGLKKACKYMKIPFEGPAHNALQDALNTFKIFCVLTTGIRPWV